MSASQSDDNNRQLKNTHLEYIIGYKLIILKEFTVIETQSISRNFETKESIVREKYAIV